MSPKIGTRQTFLGGSLKSEAYWAECVGRLYSWWGGQFFKLLENNSVPKCYLIVTHLPNLIVFVYGYCVFIEDVEERHGGNNYLGAAGELADIQW